MPVAMMFSGADLDETRRAAARRRVQVVVLVGCREHEERREFDETPAVRVERGNLFVQRALLRGRVEFSERFGRGDVRCHAANFSLRFGAAR